MIQEKKLIIPAIDKYDLMKLKSFSVANSMKSQLTKWNTVLDSLLIW